MMKQIVVMMVLATPLASFSVDPRCQSSSICTYSTMPLLRQSDPKLTQFVAIRIGKDPVTYKDPGLCAAVSGSMAISALMKEKDQATRPGSDLLVRWQSLTPENATYLFGKAAKTDFVKGGTYSTDLKKGYEAIYRFVNFVSYKLDFVGTSFLDNFDKFGEYSHQQITHHMSQHKHLMHVSLLPAAKKEKRVLWTTVTWYEVQKMGHSVIFNGHDSGKIKVFDPWGGMYPIVTSISSVKLNPLWSQKVTVVNSAGPTQGFSPVGYVGNETKGKGNLVLIRDFVRAGVR